MASTSSRPPVPRRSSHTSSRSGQPAARVSPACGNAGKTGRLDDAISVDLQGCREEYSFMAEMGKLIEEMTKAGVLLATEGCLPSARGARVGRSGETLTVTDGPFAETKEVVGGFALMQAETKI